MFLCIYLIIVRSQLYQRCQLILHHDVDISTVNSQTFTYFVMLEQEGYTLHYIHFGASTVELEAYLSDYQIQQYQDACIWVRVSIATLFLFLYIWHSFYCSSTNYLHTGTFPLNIIVNQSSTCTVITKCLNTKQRRVVIRSNLGKL